MSHIQNRAWSVYRHVLATAGLCLMVASLGRLPAATASADCQRHVIKRSTHFLLHTDQSPGDAELLLERLEKTLADSADYWGRETRGTIECYVVDDLTHWAGDCLPHPAARLVIDRIGGVTLIDKAGAGIHARRQVTILAASKQGVAEHEVVHAYCALMFGVTGPAWYREGIAQVFAHDQKKENEAACPRDLILDLAGTAPKSIHDVIRGSSASRKLAGSLKTKMRRGQEVAGMLAASNWTAGDVRELESLKKEYAWSWLACHLLYHNPNYERYFKSLGQDYLAKRRDSFSTLFGPMMEKLSFEYRFTLERIEPGYRVDLCHWEWDRRFRCVKDGYSRRVRIEAARGYQASGARVRKGECYQAKTRGRWKTDPGRPSTTAAGDVHGRGRLQGIVMNNYQLSRPFDISDQGTFRAPADGCLYLRCRDAWSQLADNEGSVVVTLQDAGDS